MLRFLSLLLLIFFSINASARDKIVNIYAWTGEVPSFVIQQFEKETGIKVNFSTYENNEIMYSKLRANKNAGYDLVMPSSYFVDRMQRQGMLTKLDKTKIPNWKNLNPDLLHPAYDPDTQFCMPFLWGVTGMFFNKLYYPKHHATTWNSLWSKRYHNQLMLLDDTREIFSMALITLGYSVNDRDPEHIKQAYLKLKELMPNVKVFSSETVVSIMIDEDANIGMTWNGDAFKAIQENPDIQFIFPTDSFVIWMDNFAIPIGAEHKDEAYAFLDFILRPEIAKSIALATNFATTNLAGQKLLPANIRNNPTIYPSKAILAHGQYEVDVGDDTLALYEKYWEELKMGG